MGHSIWRAGRRRSWGSSWSTIIARRSWCNAVGIGASLFLLGLVANEVNFGFAGLSGSWCGYNNIGLLFGLLDQHIDQCLLLGLGQLWYNGSCGCWWWWSLNEDNFVVLLWWRHNNGFSANSKQKYTNFIYLIVFIVKFLFQS